MDLLVHDDVAGDQAANLALEEALARAGPPSPVLRIWQNACCVVLGRAQRAAREVNLAACAASGVPVLRRASGGGTVYQDLGILNLSLAAPGRDRGLAAGLAELVTAVAAGLGLAARAGDRGVFVGPAKVSGLASQVTRDGSLAHATLLVTTPASRVGAFLSPAPDDPHPADSRRSPVAALRELGCEVSVAATRAAVLAEAARRYGPLAQRPLTQAERSWQERLLAERYRIGSWHMSGRTKEAQWTTRPALTCTG
ncbi:MAG TPA: lipoate--protein ligase family protein [Streptosporangiaceae bacterium]|nr:lipoate--protein ligase family protein [Streptosporangiaceae bacterium]